MPRWLAAVIVIGVALDLVISSVLIYHQSEIDNNNWKINCYTRVLDQAVKHPQPKYQTGIRRQAEACVKIP